MAAGSGGDAACLLWFLGMQAEGGEWGAAARVHADAGGLAREPACRPAAGGYQNASHALIE